MNTLLRFLFLSVSLCFIFNCSSKKDINWVSYHNEEENLTIEYPKEWEIIEGPDYGLFLLGEPKKNENDKFKENMVFRVDTGKAVRINFDSIAIDRKEIAKGSEWTFSDGENSEQTLGKYTYKIHRYDGSVKDLNIQWKQYFLMENGKTSTFSFSAELQKMKDYEAIADKIVASMKRK